jgi:hypothetical protein
MTCEISQFGWMLAVFPVAILLESGRITQANAPLAMTSGKAFGKNDLSRFSKQTKMFACCLCGLIRENADVVLFATKRANGE